MVLAKVITLLFFGAATFLLLAGTAKTPFGRNVQIFLVMAIRTVSEYLKRRREEKRIE